MTELETLRAQLKKAREALEYYAGNFDGKEGTHWVKGRFLEEDKFGRCSPSRPDTARNALAQLRGEKESDE